ncbi:MAG: MarR family transcriptional regulator, partial [Alphaproteobacteria bacterium]|nr:MarR family transcriptional regulator [Alphaproteobacteria bacterium]
MRNRSGRCDGFNRLVTQRVGALEESYLRRGRPLGEARLIFETRAEGAELRALRNRLGLDSGYLSRLLRSLEAQGLVTVEGESADRRRRRVRLTSEGRAELAAYDRLSDELAASMLVPLSADERERLLAAMTEIERLIRAASIEIRVVSPQSAAVRRCLAAYFRELAARFESGFNSGEGDPAPEEEMTPPNGFFVVARIDGRAVGCGGLRRIGKRVGEIKRMWTAPEARGQGVARRMLHELEALARDAGIEMLRLDTNRVLVEAQAMYRREGYREI